MANWLTQLTFLTPYTLLVFLTEAGRNFLFFLLFLLNIEALVQ